MGLGYLRALMGAGALYVVKDPELESSDSNVLSSDSDFVKSGSHVNYCGAYFIIGFKTVNSL